MIQIGEKQQSNLHSNVQNQTKRNINH